MEIEQTDWKQIEFRNDNIKIESRQFIYAGHHSLENYYAIMWNHPEHIISICKIKDLSVEENHVIELEKYKYFYS